MPWCNLVTRVTRCAVSGSTIWERITRFKAPVIESRESASFQACIDDYKAKLEQGGAVLFAVCRGKVGSRLTEEGKKCVCVSTGQALQKRAPCPGHGVTGFRLRQAACRGILCSSGRPWVELWL